MIYLDTDFIINYLIVQNKDFNRIAKKKFEAISDQRKIFISLLTLQEISFVLAKLRMDSYRIIDYISSIEKYVSINYTFSEFKRAQELAFIIGFQNINDCLHTAIAESHCKELYTFNINDFSKIKNYTDLKINMLTT
jgi:predicted nucleic acid-binding protein